MRTSAASAVSDTRNNPEDSVTVCSTASRKVRGTAGDTHSAHSKGAEVGSRGWKAVGEGVARGVGSPGSVGSTGGSNVQALNQMASSTLHTSGTRHTREYTAAPLSHGATPLARPARRLSHGARTAWGNLRRGPAPRTAALAGSEGMGLTKGRSDGTVGRKMVRTPRCLPQYPPAPTSPSGLWASVRAR